MMRREREREKEGVGGKGDEIAMHLTLSLLFVNTTSRALVLVPSGRGTMIIKSDSVWVQRYVGRMPPLPGAVVTLRSQRELEWNID